MDLIKREEEEEVDRITNLPDSLIHHILSSLHIKHVAQTSVLSKRWSYIWITHPILDFQDSKCSTSTSSESDDSECFTPTSSDTNTSPESQTNDFMDFVDGTLHRRHSGANIQRFAITWSQHLNKYRVNSWITSVVRHNVEQLSLCLDQGSNPMIITRSLNVRIPNHISFPKLKCLVLDGVEFSDDDEYWNENLFSNCSVLEDFNIPRCTWFDIPNFCISAPALKNFKMDLWEDVREDAGLRGCALKVDAPNLESFYYDASIAKEYVLTTFPLLVRAAVLFRFKPKRKQRIGHGAAVSQFFRALANVKRLSVSDDTLKVFLHAYEFRIVYGSFFFSLFNQTP
ncbi:putative F-box/LRR-repeat protein At3g58880 [Papaver somniferum]|uniref:putative F-box/LRR-repeat protein At3g58880 n=1 Tax=Papaver somniferum TaxID=3469 RepID=UPI000E6FD140|nr:putative F-box/LRR-repeat protein At3g58880 [Papaver somniferum]